ncbi:Hypothetical protein D9617_1g080070 [Elsinoe fawcettii]|nr:Hypothetical protein D9617_1g080070 [Elsinoe fawcettii]
MSKQDKRRAKKSRQKSARREERLEKEEESKKMWTARQAGLAMREEIARVAEDVTVAVGVRQWDEQKARVAEEQRAKTAEEEKACRKRLAAMAIADQGTTECEDAADEMKEWKGGR